MHGPQRSSRTLVGSPALPVAVVVFAAAAGVLLAGGGAAGAQDESGGAAVYAANCAGCHQPGGEGLPGTFPPLAGNPAAADPDYVATVVREGLSGPLEVLGVGYDGVMPPFGNLSDAAVAAVAEHVAGLATGAGGDAGEGQDAGEDEEAAPAAPETTVPAAPPSSGAADRGRQLFTGSAGLAGVGTPCASCHSAGDVSMAGGSGLGPDLSDVYGRLGGEPGLTAWLANPASPTMMPIFADRPLTDDEVADLVAFLADAADHEPAGSGVDWLPIAGAIGLAGLLAAMAIGFRTRRRPYAHQLAATAATTRSPR